MNDQTLAQQLMGRENFKRLTIHIMSLKMVHRTPFVEVLNSISRGAINTQLMKDSALQAEAYIDAVISAPNNPYGEDREAIAAELMRKIERNESSSQY
jgi:hypothetical protein